MADILIRNARWLVTLDPGRRIITDGAVAIEDRKILDIGKTYLLEKRHKAQHIIDASGKLVLPGLIDGHLHNGQHLARGVGDGVGIEKWLYERVYPFEAAMEGEDAYWGAMLCQLEMIRAGTTCFIDPGSYFPDQTARATERTGMRGIISRSALDLHETPLGRVPSKMFSETTGEALSEGENVIKKWNGAFDGRLKASLCLRTMLDCSDELILKTAALSRKYKVGIQTHCDAGLEASRASKVRFGITGVERLEKLGGLGPATLLIHLGGVDLKGVYLIKERDAKVVVCPQSSAHHGGSCAPYLPEMNELGITTCLGSDSGAEGNYLDIVRAMNFATLSFKRDRQDASVLPPETLIEMATINGARAGLWEQEIGSLELGKRADISIFDARRPEWRPTHNPLANLVYCATGASADTVIVDGKILMEERKLLQADVDAVAEEAERRAYQISERAGLSDSVKPKWPFV